MAHNFEPSTEYPIIHNRPTAQDPKSMRVAVYSVEQQLNFLFDDIEAGLFGEAAKTGKFFQYVAGVKAAYPAQQ